MNPDTIKVERVKDGASIVINATDFDPAKHRLPGEKPKRTRRTRKGAAE